MSRRLIHADPDPNQPGKVCILTTFFDWRDWRSLEVPSRLQPPCGYVAVASNNPHQLSTRIIGLLRHKAPAITITLPYFSRQWFRESGPEKSGFGHLYETGHTPFIIRYFSEDILFTKWRCLKGK